MATRTALLNGNVINRDTDFSKCIETVSEPWVIDWLEVSATKVWIWKARVPCERTNWETMYALVYNNSEVSISWNGDVYIKLSQTYIDDWELANEDWTWIATIEVGTMPDKNALKLAVITWWVVEDKRNLISTVWELNTKIQSIFADIDDLDERVNDLEEQWAIEALAETWIVWEKYTLTDKLYRQYQPALASSSLDCYVWNTTTNTQIHIQRIWSWVATNKLTLKLRSVWEPTTWLIVEVRKWVKVDIDSSEAYWYWWDLIASWSIAYWDVSNSYNDYEITLNNQFWWTKGELLDIVVYQTDNIVNSTNYYCIACDDTQIGQAYRYVAVNWNTRTPSTSMPCVISDWFCDSLIAKINIPNSNIFSTTWQLSSYNYQSTPYTYTYTTQKNFAKLIISIDWTYSWSWNSNQSTASSWVVVTVWWVQKLDQTYYDSYNSSKVPHWAYVELENIPAWTQIQFSITLASSVNYSGWGHNDSTGIFNVHISDTYIWANRILLPTKVEPIGNQIEPKSFGRINWKWYGEFSEQTYNSCSTWAITVPNCFWFKMIIWDDWNQYKIPIFLP